MKKMYYHDASSHINEQGGTSVLVHSLFKDELTKDAILVRAHHLHVFHFISYGWCATGAILYNEAKKY